MPKVRNTRRENHAASMTTEMPLKVSIILNTHDTADILAMAPTALIWYERRA